MEPVKISGKLIKQWHQALCEDSPTGLAAKEDSVPYAEILLEPPKEVKVGDEVLVKGIYEKNGGKVGVRVYGGNNNKHQIIAILPPSEPKCLCEDYPDYISKCPVHGDKPREKPFYGTGVLETATVPYKEYRRLADENSSLKADIAMLKDNCEKTEPKGLPELPDKIKAKAMEYDSELVMMAGKIDQLITWAKSVEEKMKK